MSILTQHNPNAALNRTLLEAGATKTVYALVTPETEATRLRALGFHDAETRYAYLGQFRDAWTGKQDAYHEEFFDRWHTWSAPLVDLDRDQFPYYYPTAGASEALRHIIFALAAEPRSARTPDPQIHVFEGEYEGYKAMAEAAGLHVWEHKRDDWQRIKDDMVGDDLFFISQPSAIDGNIWPELATFLGSMSEGLMHSVVVDLTYVGAVQNPGYRFNMNKDCIRNVVFSLSKPFGAYYDRIGGVFCRDEDPGLFGNRWFKNLTSLSLGKALMEAFDVFHLPNKLKPLQARSADGVGRKLGFTVAPSDVFILATAETADDALRTYLTRAGRARLCLTPLMAAALGTAGSI